MGARTARWRYANEIGFGLTAGWCEHLIAAGEATSMQDWNAAIWQLVGDIGAIGFATMIILVLIARWRLSRPGADKAGWAVLVLAALGGARAGREARESLRQQ
jgi:hypothetical protein